MLWKIRFDHSLLFSGLIFWKYRPKYFSENFSFSTIFPKIDIRMIFLCLLYLSTLRSDFLVMFFEFFSGYSDWVRFWRFDNTVKCVIFVISYFLPHTKIKLTAKQNSIFSLADFVEYHLTCEMHGFKLVYILSTYAVEVEVVSKIAIKMLVF